MILELNLIWFNDTKFRLTDSENPEKSSVSELKYCATIHFKHTTEIILRRTLYSQEAVLWLNGMWIKFFSCCYTLVVLYSEITGNSTNFGGDMETSSGLKCVWYLKNCIKWRKWSLQAHGNIKMISILCTLSLSLRTTRKTN